MTTRDGVRLDADIHQPAAPGRYPVLLMRQPYGRRIACTICYAHPSWYAAHGYIVVIQDVRGRGTSEGTFRLFADDKDDGADSIEWAAGLPDSSGAVGMYGFSYQGSNQLLAAARGITTLKAMAPAMIGWNLRTDWAYENDAFCLAAGLSWATQIAAENARLAGDETAFNELFTASRSLPLHEAVPVRPAFIARNRKYTHYFDWIDNPGNCDYWRSISPDTSADYLAASGPPMLFIGGWYDSHLPGTLAAYQRIAASGNVPARLIIGPWGHFPWGQKLGAVDFGADAVSPIDDLQIRWFDRWLKGIDNGVEHEAAVTLFDMGSHQWRRLESWPKLQSQLYLTGEGRGALNPRDGRLAPQPDADGIDRIVHDPWRPVPTIGGAFGSPPGPVDRSATDSRPDVLTFTTEPLDRPLDVTGVIDVMLFATSDTVSFDISCTLSRITLSGQVLPLADGYRHLAGPHTDQPINISMRATCLTLAPGERLRLSIAGASFPAYPVNPGTGQNPTCSRRIDAQITTISVGYGALRPSRVTISSPQ